MHSLVPPDAVSRAWAVLTSALESHSGEHRVRGTEALGGIQRNAKANAAAEKALSDRDAAVRVAAATAIGEMNDRAAIPKLHAALDDKELKVVLAAANSLYFFKDAAAYQIYFAIVTGKRKASEGVIHSQLDALRNPKQVEKLAFEAGIGFVPYAGLGWDVWQHLSSDHGSSVRAAAAEKLATDPDPESEKALREASGDNDWRVRAAVANAIGHRHDPALADCATAMLDDENEAVRLQAAAATVELATRHQSK